MCVIVGARDLNKILLAAAATLDNEVEENSSGVSSEVELLGRQQAEDCYLV